MAKRSDQRRDFRDRWYDIVIFLVRDLLVLSVNISAHDLKFLGSPKLTKLAQKIFSEGSIQAFLQPEKLAEATSAEPAS